MAGNNTVSYINRAVMSNRKLTGEDFFDFFCGVNGLNNMSSRMQNARILELIMSVLGPVTSRELLDIGCPFEYDDENKQALFRLVSRELSAKKIEKVTLRHVDGASRAIYGLTKKGLDGIEHFKELRGCYARANETGTSYHGYALGRGIASMLTNQMNIAFDIEVVSDVNDYGLNDAESFRSDAVIRFNGSSYYIEQDMGTETIANVAKKIVAYNDPDKVMILASHKAVQLKGIDNATMEKIVDLSSVFENISDVRTDRRTMRFLEMLSSLSGTGNLRQMIAYNNMAREKIAECMRLVKLYNNSQTRRCNLYNHIQKNPDIKSRALSGARLYCIPSELLYHCRAFRKDDEAIIRGMYGNIDHVSREKTSSGQVIFNGYVMLLSGERIVIEYPEEDVCAMVRIVEYCRTRQHNSGIRAVIYVNTGEFAEKLCRMLCEEVDSVPTQSAVMVCENDKNVYAMRLGRLIAIDERILNEDR